MLYCHYQYKTISSIPNIQGFSSKIELIDLVFSSTSHSVVVFGSTDFNIVKGLVILIKQIPSSQRSFDPKYKIWTIPKPAFQTIQNTNIIILGNYIAHLDLETFIKGLEGKESEFEKQKVPKPEDFFYNHGQPVGQPQLTPETSRKNLVDFLTRESIQVFENGDLIKSYKMAARKLHPDLNGGDHSKMSELNMLWQQYKQIAHS